MKIVFLCLFTVLSFSSLGAQQAAFREFTNKEGQTMMARPVNVVGEQVRIQRQDGAEFTVPVDIFSKKDQDFLRNWSVQFLASNGRLLELGARSATGNRRKTEPGVGFIAYEYEGFYRITLKNTSDIELTELKVDYRFFVFQNTVGANRRSEGRDIRISGSEIIEAFSPRAELTLETRKADMRDTELKPGYYWADGGRAKSSDSLKGIWIRVYHNDKLVAEFANPTAIPEREDW